MTLTGSTFALVGGSGTNTDQIKNFQNFIGGSGGDTIKGDAVANVITGGGGNDKLTGGLGNDTFVFNPGFGNDNVTDFTVGAPGADHDILDISAALAGVAPGTSSLVNDAAGFTAFENAHVFINGNHVQLRFNEGATTSTIDLDTVIVTGTTLNDAAARAAVIADDFRFH